MKLPLWLNPSACCRCDLGNTSGERTFGFYEPAGGTAPNAGKDLANPIARSGLPP